MPVRVLIPSPLRPLTGGAPEVQVEAATIAAMLDALGERHPGLAERLREPEGELRPWVRLFVNDEDVRFLQDERTALAPADTVAIVPAVAGG